MQNQENICPHCGRVWIFTPTCHATHDGWYIVRCRALGGDAATGCGLRFRFQESTENAVTWLPGDPPPGTARGTERSHFCPHCGRHGGFDFLPNHAPEGGYYCVCADGMTPGCGNSYRVLESPEHAAAHLPCDGPTTGQKIWTCVEAFADLTTGIMAIVGAGYLINKALSDKDKK